MEAIASSSQKTTGVEAIATTLEAIASRLEAITSTSSSKKLRVLVSRASLLFGTKDLVRRPCGTGEMGEEWVNGDRCEGLDVWMTRSKREDTSRNPSDGLHVCSDSCPLHSKHPGKG